jgi:hypothetical protein
VRGEETGPVDTGPWENAGGVRGEDTGAIEGGAPPCEDGVYE